MAFILGVISLLVVAILVVGIRRVLNGSRIWLAVVIVLAAMLGALAFKYWTEEASNCSLDSDLIACLRDQAST